MFTSHFGSVAAATIRSMDIDKLPLIALVYRLRGTTEIFQVGVGIFFFFLTLELLGQLGFLLLTLELLGQLGL